MLPENFLKYSGEHYNENRKKWSVRLKKEGLSFSEDIFNDSILKVYDILHKHNIEDRYIEGFWYKSFLINTKREKEYAFNSKRDDDVDVLQYLDNFPNEDRDMLLSDIEDKLKNLTEVEKNILLIYYLTDISIKDLEELTEIKDIRYKIKGIIKKIRGTKN